MSMGQSIDLAMVEKSICHRGFRLVLGQRGRGNTAACFNLYMQTYAQGEALPEAAILSPDAAQTLLDNLWSSGLRPTRDVDKSAEVEYLRGQLDRATKFAFGE